MKLKNIKLWFLILILPSLIKCKVDTVGPLEHSNQRPGKVSNVSVKNAPGKATISYKLPMDQDLLYVKAVYRLTSGVKREVKSSYYNNSLVADGFAEEQEYEVKLYAV